MHQASGESSSPRLTGPAGHRLMSPREKMSHAVCWNLSKFCWLQKPKVHPTLQVVVDMFPTFGSCLRHLHFGCPHKGTIADAEPSNRIKLRLPGLRSIEHCGHADKACCRYSKNWMRDVTLGAVCYMRCDETPKPYMIACVAYVSK